MSDKFEQIIKQIPVNPYYRDENICLYNCDCNSIFQYLHHENFDIAICDPPYNILKKATNVIKNPNDKKDFDISWDDKIPDKKYFDELFRI